LVMGLDLERPCKIMPALGGALLVGAVAHGSRCGELIEVRAIFPCRVQRGEHWVGLVDRESCRV